MNSLLVASICSAIASQYNPACMTAVSASLIQTGVSKDLNNAQDALTRKIETLNPNEPALTYLGVACKIGVSKKINYTLTNFIVSDRINLGISQTSVTMGLEWRF